MAQARTIWGSGYQLVGTPPNNGFSFGLPGVSGTVSYLANCHVGASIAKPPISDVSASGTNVTTVGFFAPIIPANTPAAPLNVNRDASVAGCSLVINPAASATLSLSASVDPNALRFHFFNLDTGTYQFGSGVTPNRLAGNNVFDIVGQRVNNTAGSAINGGCEANDGTNPAGSCGTVNFTSASTTITSMDWVMQEAHDNAGIGDGHTIAISLTQPSLLIRKQTVGGTGGTTFTLNYPSNVVTSAAAGNVVATTEGIAVATNGTFVSGQPRFIANSGHDTVITELVPAGWQMSRAQCIDLANGNAIVASLAGPITGPANASLTLPAANVAPTSQIECDFTTTIAVADLSVTKTNGVDVLRAGGQTSYALVVSNAGPAAANGAIVKDQPGIGLSGCAVTDCAGSAGAACPVAPANILATNGVAIPNFPSGSSVVFTLQCNVN